MRTPGIAHCWHDNLIYGLQFRAADPEVGDWRSDLVLDIDHIVEWVLDESERIRFRVAPATLTFHDVTDLNLAVDFGSEGHTINELSMDRIEQDLDRDPVTPGGLPRYRWRIALNLPVGGEIRFRGSRFTQTLRAASMLMDEQRLPPNERPPVQPRAPVRV